MRLFVIILISFLLNIQSTFCNAADTPEARQSPTNKTESKLTEKELVSNLRANVLHQVQKRDAIQKLFSGAMPSKIYSSELFLIDLRNEDSVSQRIEELRDFLTSPENDGVESTVNITIEDIQKAGASQLKKYEASFDLEIAQLSLTFLRKPLNERVAFLDAEAAAQSQAKDFEAAEKAKILALEQQSKAEESQRLAIVEATKAKDIESKALANEIVKAEGVQAALAKLKAELLGTISKLTDTRIQKTSHIFELQELVRKVQPESEEAAKLYDQIILEVASARSDLSAAINTMKENKPVPSYMLTEEVPGPLTNDIQKIKNIEAKITDLRNEVLDLKKQVTLENASYAENYASQANKIRLSLLAKLPEEKHGSVLGLGKEGINQFWREVTHLNLIMQWMVISINPTISEFIKNLSSPFAMAMLVIKIAFLGFIIFISKFVAHYGQNWINILRTNIATSTNEPTLRKLFISIFSPLIVVWKELVLLLTLLLLPEFFPAEIANIFVSTILKILISVAVYKLVTASAYNMILWLSKTSLGAMPLKRKTKGAVLDN